jgi:hypothetical protein
MKPYSGFNSFASAGIELITLSFYSLRGNIPRNIMRGKGETILVRGTASDEYRRKTIENSEHRPR